MYCSFSLHLLVILHSLNLISGDIVHVFQMSTKVTTLCECFLAVGTLKRTLSCMFSEMVPQIAALFENTLTVRVFALEIQLHSLSFRILHSNGLMPLFRYAFEGFVLASS